MKAMHPGRPTDAAQCGAMAALLAELGLLWSAVPQLTRSMGASTMYPTVLWCTGALIGLSGAWAWLRLRREPIDRRSRWLGAAGMLLACGAVIGNVWLVVARH